MKSSQTHFHILSVPKTTIYVTTPLVIPQYTPLAYAVGSKSSFFLQEPEDQGLFCLIIEQSILLKCLSISTNLIYAEEIQAGLTTSFIPYLAKQ
jgi:hypothetical protein